MSISRRDLIPWRRTARSATLVIAFTLFAAAQTAVTRAQTKEAASTAPTTTTPQAEFQYSALTGSGNTMLATRVPAFDSDGNVYYWDVTVLFDVESDGKLKLDPAYPQIVKSPGPLVSAFKAGNYVGPSTILGGKALITVTGPGVTTGGATEWSLAASPGADPCTYPNMAQWYVGPLANNPEAPRLKAAGITSTAYWYGVGGSNCETDEYTWLQNTLMGFSQIGDTLTIVSFTRNGSDYNTVQDTIIYTLKP
jgi:hypothetical protein